MLKRICDNENFAISLKCHMDFDNSNVIVTSTALMEAEKHGYNYPAINEVIRTRLNAQAKYEMITKKQHMDAKNLEDIHPTLHAGDSDMLAFAIDEETTLVTCDKGLAAAAAQAKCHCINPDTLPCDTYRRPLGAYEAIVKKTIKAEEISITLQN